jgi:mRNA interferase MazF
MLTSGDVVDVDLGVRAGREAGFRHPAVVVTAQRVLDAQPNVVQVVPLTSTLRGFASEVEVDAEPANGLEIRSAAQCQHIRAVATSLLSRTRGNVGSAVLTQIRELLGLILDLPGEAEPGLVGTSV